MGSEIVKVFESDAKFSIICGSLIGEISFSFVDR